MGKVIRSEPDNADMVYKHKDVKPIFEQAGWLNYFDKMKKGDVAIAMEFARTYNNAVAEVRGLKVQADTLTIARVSGLRHVGKDWFERRVLRKPFIEEFLESGEVVQNEEKGTVRASLPAPWDEVALWVIKFITCEGRFSLLSAYHFKILSHLRHKKFISMPYFLSKSLDLMCGNVKRSSDNTDTSLAHHGLIRLLVEDALQKQNQTWESFIGMSPSTGQASKRRRNTLEIIPETPRKKSVHTEVETPSSSRSGNKKEQQHQGNSLSQNDDPDKRPEELITPRSSRKSWEKQIELQDLGKHQKKRKWRTAALKRTRATLKRTQFLLGKYRRAYSELRKDRRKLMRTYQKQTEEVTALRAKLQRLEGHKMDTLLEVMDWTGEQSEDARETFSDRGAEISRLGNNTEQDEGFEAGKAENRDDVRIQKLEDKVAQLQATAGELEEQLNLAREQRKGETQETMTEQLQKHDYVHAIKRLSQEVQKLQSEKEHMNFLANSMRNLRPPSSLYSVFLKEQLISFRLETVKMGYNDHIGTGDQFIAAFCGRNEEEQDFLCELYMHNLIMIDYEDWDPNPHAGDIQLRAFMSFMRNQLRWNNAATTAANIERGDALWVRGSPSPEKLLTATKDQAFVTLLEIAQIKVVRECKDWIPFHKVKALDCLQRRVNALSPELSRKDPFSIRMFKQALDRVETYLYFLDMHKTKWIGLRFHFPILWCPVKDEEDSEFKKIVIEQRGFYTEAEGGYSFYKWSDECLNSSPSTPVSGAQS